MLMMPVDDHIALALPRPALDAPYLVSLIKDDSAQIGYYLPWALGTTLEKEQLFLAQRLLQFGQGKSLDLVIWVDGNPAGMISFNSFDDSAQSADIGYWLGRSFRGSGVIARSLDKMAALAFSPEYNLSRLTLEAAVDNEASKAVARRAGFTLSGVLKNHLVLRDGRHDANCFVLTKERWEQAR